MNDKLLITPDLLHDFLTENVAPHATPSAAEIAKTEEALVAFARLHATEPPLSMRSQILTKMARLTVQRTQSQSFTLQNLPLLTAESNHLDWEKAVAHLEPTEEFDNIFPLQLIDDAERELYLMWVKTDVEEEIHTDCLESFILLQGSCECLIESTDGQKRTVRMTEGDYLSFELDENHYIKITSHYPVKAIMQRLKLAA